MDELKQGEIIKRIFISLVFIAILNALSFCKAEAEVLHIPTDYSTIQEGINTAIVGDTILVAPGTYGENINFNGSNITVASLYLTTQDKSYISKTIIDGNQNGGVVTFENGEDSTAFLCGFTIVHGNNVFGGGIYCKYSSSPSLENVIISENSASHSGGGIYCKYSSSPCLKNLIIINNTSTSYGGGIYCEDNSSPDLDDVTISGNYSHHGGGICCLFDSSPSLKNVIISDNTATWYGGGIGCFYESNIHVENATIVGNSASDRGAGIYCYESSPTLINTIVSCNMDNYGLYAYSCEPSVVYSDFYENEFGNFCGCGEVIGVNVSTNIHGDSCDAHYNIQENPLFVDPVNGDYHLSWIDYPVPDETMSPCIDAGDPNSPPDPDGTIADIGAFYFQQGVSVDELAQTSEFNLKNYPNPITSNINNLTISFFVKNPGNIKIQLFNVKGQLVSTIIHEDKDSGKYLITYPINELSSGIYFTRMNVDGIEREIRKVVLLR